MRNVIELLILPGESADEHSKASNNKSFQLPEFCTVQNQIIVALYQVVAENLKEKPPDRFTRCRGGFDVNWV